MRRLVFTLLGGCLAAGAVPAWWTALKASPRLESPFVQESESAVFGKLKRTGRLAVLPGGRVRVAYDKGLLVICDGKVLVQYDPATRTAQKFSLAACQREMPLLGILVDPAALDRAYEITASGEVMELAPRKPGTPKIRLEGRAGRLHRIQWTDATGAAQSLELTQPRSPGALPPSTFRFQAPAGTRWAGQP